MDRKVIARNPAFAYNLLVIIDCHTHIFPPDVKENRSGYAKLDACFAELYSDPRAKIVTAPELVESMDRAGIDVSVALNIGWRSPELCRKTNDYILESVSKYPKKLIGFCTVDPSDIETSVKELERCARGGAKGVGELRPDLERDFANATITAPFLEIMKKYNLALTTHASEPVGHNYPGKGSLTLGVLYMLIQRLSGISIICAHFGGGLPFYALMPEVRVALERVYFDSAASPYLYSPQIFRHATEIAGKTKVLFGSDYPVITQERVLKDIYSAGLDSDTEELVLSGNARRLFGIKEV